MQEEQNNSSEISQSLEDIKNAIYALSKKVDSQDERLLRLEKESAAQYNRSVAHTEPVQDSSALSFQAPPPPAPAVPSAPAMQVISKQSNGDLEQNIGGKWFARIGVTALVLGVSFFLKYAFDNNWIEPLGRVMIGVISGLILLGVGEKTIRKYPVYGQIITGGGIAILYLSIFAAFDFYHLMSQVPAFVCMAIITAVGIALSLRYDAISLIMVAVLGGFCTPFLISTGVNNQFGLLSYILILDLAILAVSIFRKWRWLNLVGFVGTFFVFATWAGEFYSRSQLFSTMFFLSLFFIVYSLSALVYNLAKKEKSSGVEQALTILSVTVFFGASYILLNDDYHAFMGFFALIMSIYYFLGAYLVRIITVEDENLYNFLAFLTVGFITLAIPLQFDQNVITIGWFIEAVLLILLGMKVRKESLSTFGSIVFVLATLRLLMVDTSLHIENNFFIFNKIFFTFFVGILVSYLLAYLSRGYEESSANTFIKRSAMIALFVIVANFLTIFSVSREIIVYYDNQAEKLMAERNQQENEMKKYGKRQNEYYDSSAYRSYSIKLDKLESRSSVTLSLFWLFYGIVLMVGGIVGKYKGVRLGGMALLILAILKLFFFDLWSLGTLYRIVSSISLGVVLLSISFAYQKYHDKIKEII